MRVNKLSKIILSIFLAFAIQFFSVQKVVANDTLDLGQKILPVCLVYLTPGGKIFNIWRNVNQIDDSYVIKFLDQESKELPLNKGLFSQYIQKSQKDFVDKSRTESVRFLNSGDYLEEVLTVV